MHGAPGLGRGWAWAKIGSAGHFLAGEGPTLVCPACGATMRPVL